MFGGTLFFVIVGALYILFAFIEPPEAIATLFRVPVIAVFFRPEKRMKYGRLTVGALLMLVGPLLLLAPGGAPTGRPSPLGIVAVLIILGALLWARWKRAGEVSGADDAERRAQWQSFEILKRDPRFLHLQQYLYTKGYRTTFERVSDPVTYRIAYMTLFDAQGQRVLAQPGAPASSLIAYLERDAAPKRIQVSLALQTGACHEHELGWVIWSGCIPAQSATA